MMHSKFPRANVRRARSVVGASTAVLGIALWWGCSSSLVRSSRSRRATPDNAVGVSANKGQSSDDARSSAMAASFKNAGQSPSPTQAQDLVTPAKSMPPVLSAELVRLRRVAVESVLGGHYRLPSAPIYYGQVSPQNSVALVTPVPALSDPEPITAASALPADSPLIVPQTTSAPVHFVAIENESSLDHFHQALARLDAGQDEDGRVRILAYGASHTQADIYPGYLRAYLQRRFGDGGQGYVQLGRVNHWYRTFDTNVRHAHMSVHHARYRVDVEDEPLGLMGVALVADSGDGYGEITTAPDSPNTRFELQYYAQPHGGDMRLQIDGKMVARIKTQSDQSKLAYFSFGSTPGRHSILVQRGGKGNVRLFGVSAETSRPGVVLDTLGISGSQIISQLRWNESVWAEAVRHRNPDLVTFAYGTNEIADASLTLPEYERKLRAVLGRLRRALPQVSCLLISPFDLPTRVAGRWVTRPRLLEFIDAQRRLSKDFNCGFWDGRAFTGGDGSLHRWVLAKPPLASTDYIHLTRLGYAYAGIALGDALMRTFDVARIHSPDPASGASLMGWPLVGSIVRKGAPPSGVP